MLMGIDYIIDGLMVRLVRLLLCFGSALLLSDIFVDNNGLNLVVFCE